jgi:hypothetical protein
LGVSRQGNSKNTTQIFLQKVQCRKYFAKKRQKFNVGFPLTCFVLSRFWALPVSQRSATGVQQQKHNNMPWTKKVRVEKWAAHNLQKNRGETANSRQQPTAKTKNKSRFVSRFCLSRLWALGEGSMSSV